MALLSRQINLIAIHHSASPRSTTTEQIRKWHMDPKRPGGPFEDIGYHWVIEDDGRWVRGRDMYEYGAHARGHNRNSIGICVTGDNTKKAHAWSEKQHLSLQDLLRSAKLWFPNAEILGHRDLEGQKTECPGIDIRTWLAERGMA